MLYPRAVDIVEERQPTPFVEKSGKLVGRNSNLAGQRLQRKQRFEKGPILRHYQLELELYPIGLIFRQWCPGIFGPMFHLLDFVGGSSKTNPQHKQKDHPGAGCEDSC
jgi:hypothetical protein